MGRQEEPAFRVNNNNNNVHLSVQFVENNIFKAFGQKWKVRNGTIVFQKVFVK